MAKHKAITVRQRIDDLGITRPGLALALGVGLRTVYRWLSYDAELRLSPSQYVTICDLLQWSGQELAAAYELGQVKQKKALGAKPSPGQISLLT